MFRSILYILGVLFSALIGGLAGSFISSHNISIYLPWNHPVQPSVISAVVTNVSQKKANEAVVILTAHPSYEPAYKVDLIKTIKNNDANALDMFLEIKTASITFLKSVF